jgi:ech hydrogenase subunit D
MTFEEETLIPIEIGELLAKTEHYKKDGNRLVQIGCTKVGDLYEINYSFDKDFVFQTIRITISQATELPSISGIYWGAFVYENEIHDLYGITVKDMNVDFKGTFYRTTVKYPFSSVIAEEETPCLNK